MGTSCDRSENPRLSARDGDRETENEREDLGDEGVELAGGAAGEDDDFEIHPGHRDETGRIRCRELPVRSGEGLLPSNRTVWRLQLMG